jgi:hypothetical protein
VVHDCGDLDVVDDDVDDDAVEEEEDDNEEDGAVNLAPLRLRCFCH